MHCGSGVRSKLLAIMLHLLEEVMVLIAEGLILSPDRLKFLPSMLQLNLCFTSNLAKAFEIPDMIRG